MSPRTLALIVIGVVAVSFSAILIRLTEAPPLTIALYRTVFGAAMVSAAGLLRRRSDFRALDRRGWGLCIVSGVFLAAHFATWIPSLDYTSVAASTVLVTTQSIWVAVGAYLLFGDRLRPVAAVGIAVAIAGTLLLAGGDVRLSGRAVIGDLLAIAGAVSAAAYFLAGRSLRQRVPLLVYVSIVYTTCAIVLVPVVAVAGQPFGGLRWQDWVLILLMALGPQILGHTVFNYLLKDVDATLLAVTIMGEPVGATLLALAFFGEAPPWTAVAGGLVILVGIYLAVTAQSRRRAAADAPIPAPIE